MQLPPPYSLKTFGPSPYCSPKDNPFPRRAKRYLLRGLSGDRGVTNFTYEKKL